MSPDNSTNGLRLIPAALIALGRSEQPVERLIGLQSAIARTVDGLCAVRLPRFRSTPLHLQPTRQGDLS